MNFRFDSTLKNTQKKEKLFSLEIKIDNYRFGLAMFDLVRLGNAFQKKNTLKTHFWSSLQNSKHSHMHISFKFQSEIRKLEK